MKHHGVVPETAVEAPYNSTLVPADHAIKAPDQLAQTDAVVPEPRDPVALEQRCKHGRPRKNRPTEPVIPNTNAIALPDAAVIEPPDNVPAGVPETRPCRERRRPRRYRLE